MEPTAQVKMFRDSSRSPSIFSPIINFLSIFISSISPEGAYPFLISATIIRTEM